MKLVEEIMSDPKEREIIEAKAMAKYNYNSAMEYTKETGRKSGGGTADGGGDTFI